jgi:hypothetical protein
LTESKIHASQSDLIILAFFNPVTKSATVFQQVSWVRHRDVHILAVGGRTFTSDPRFSARHVDDRPQDNDARFVLAIRNVEAADAGAYECQVSTKPTKTFVINLIVAGSSDCPRIVTWKHNAHIMRWNSSDSIGYSTLPTLFHAQLKSVSGRERG